MRVEMRVQHTAHTRQTRQGVPDRNNRAGARGGDHTRTCGGSRGGRSAHGHRRDNNDTGCPSRVDRAGSGTHDNGPGRAARAGIGTHDNRPDRAGRTGRRRAIQARFNLEHNITPETIKKSISNVLGSIYEADYVTVPVDFKDRPKPEKEEDLSALIRKLTAEMKSAAKELEFEKAAALRDEIRELNKFMLELG